MIHVLVGFPLPSHFQPSSLLCYPAWLSSLSSPSLGFLAVAPGPGLGPAPMSQFGTISRQISRHNSSNSSVSMVSATGTYRRAPSVTSQFSLQQQQHQQQQQQQQQQQPHINGGTPGYGQNSSKALLSPAPNCFLDPKLSLKDTQPHILPKSCTQSDLTFVATHKIFIFYICK